MSIEQVLVEVKSLSHNDKLRVMQALVRELSQEEGMLNVVPSYDLLAPYGNEEASQILFEALQAAKQIEGAV